MIEIYLVLNLISFYVMFLLQMRGGWVRKNKCTLQAVANSTRDYLRVIIFFAANSASKYNILLCHTHHILFLLQLPNLCNISYLSSISAVLFLFDKTISAMTAIFASYSAKLYNDSNSTFQHYTAFKLACSTLLCAVIFFMFLSSIRYGTQFQ